MIPRRSGPARSRRAPRTATVELRYGRVTLGRPRNDPRWSGVAPVSCAAVRVREVDPPAGVEAVEWMLLSSEPATSVAEAWRLVAWYRCRWVIEEWHRALKEGCRLEHSQLDQGQDIARLAAILGPVAVDLLRLRDLAAAATTADQPEALVGEVSAAMRAVVAARCRVSVQTLTPARFWRTLARLGGHLGRRRDPRPGWQALWHGWSQIATEAAGYELALRRKRCDEG